MHKGWYAIFEDSAAPLPGTDIPAIMRETRQVEPGIEIIQMGYRFRITKGAKMSQFDLATKLSLHGTDRLLKRTCGQKMLLASAKGVRMLKDRLLKGSPCYFDHCVGQLQATGVVKMAKHPICGSRAHFSLVSAKNGKRMQAEMPED